ncbi:hypothetical protein ACXZ9C_11140 [Streptococcus agalactiae]
MTSRLVGGVGDVCWCVVVVGRSSLVGVVVVVGCRRGWLVDRLWFSWRWSVVGFGDVIGKHKHKLVAGEALVVWWRWLALAGRLVGLVGGGGGVGWSSSLAGVGGW